MLKFMFVLLILMALYMFWPLVPIAGGIWLLFSKRTMEDIKTKTEAVKEAMNDVG